MKMIIPMLNTWSLLRKKIIEFESLSSELYSAQQHYQVIEFDGFMEGSTEKVSSELSL